MKSRIRRNLLIRCQRRISFVIITGVGRDHVTSRLQQLALGRLTCAEHERHFPGPLPLSANQATEDDKLFM